MIEITQRLQGLMATSFLNARYTALTFSPLFGWAAALAYSE